MELPRSASILCDCLKTFESKVNEIYKISSSTKGAHIEGARQLEEVHKSIMFINETFEQFEVDRKQKEKETDEDLVSLNLKKYNK